MHPQDSCVRVLLVEIRILNAITSVSECQPRRVRTEFLKRFAKSEGVARALRHLLSVQHEMPIRSHAQGPFFFGEDGSVIIDGECQVVEDEVLPGRADVHGIEVVELPLHGVRL